MAARISLTLIGAASVIRVRHVTCPTMIFEGPTVETLFGAQAQAFTHCVPLCCIVPCW
jgi:hypothetical protein